MGVYVYGCICVWLYIYNSVYTVWRLSYEVYILCVLFHSPPYPTCIMYSIGFCPNSGKNIPPVSGYFDIVKGMKTKCQVTCQIGCGEVGSRRRSQHTHQKQQQQTQKQQRQQQQEQKQQQQSNTYQKQQEQNNRYRNRVRHTEF